MPRRTDPGPRRHETEPSVSAYEQGVSRGRVDRKKTLKPTRRGVVAAVAAGALLVGGAAVKTGAGSEILKLGSSSIDAIAPDTREPNSEGKKAVGKVLDVLKKPEGIVRFPATVDMEGVIVRNSPLYDNGSNSAFRESNIIAEDQDLEVVNPVYVSFDAADINAVDINNEVASGAFVLPGEDGNDNPRFVLVNNDSLSHMTTVYQGPNPQEGPNLSGVDTEGINIQGGTVVQMDPNLLDSNLTSFDDKPTPILPIQGFDDVFREAGTIIPGQFPNNPEQPQ